MIAEKKEAKKGKKEGIQEGIKKGKEEGKIGIARGMKIDNKPIDEIIKYTGLTREKIDKIKA